MDAAAIPFAKAPAGDPAATTPLAKAVDVTAFPFAKAVEVATIPEESGGCDSDPLYTNSNPLIRNGWWLLRATTRSCNGILCAPRCVMVIVPALSGVALPGA